MAKIPGLGDMVTGAVSLLQAQAEAIAALPGAVQSLSSSVRNLAEVTAGAKDTIATLNRVVTRMDGILEELEQPLKDLGPGMTTMAEVLDDPVIKTLPDTIAQVQRDILPVLRTLADTNERVAFIAGSTERIMTFVDDTGRTIAGLPGAGLLGRRKPPTTTPPKPSIEP